MRKWYMTLSLIVSACSSSDSSAPGEASRAAPKKPAEKEPTVEPLKKLPESGNNFEFMDPLTNRKLKGVIDSGTRTVTIVGDPLLLQGELVTVAKNTNITMIRDENGGFGACDRYRDAGTVGTPLAWEAGVFRLEIEEPTWPADTISAAKEAAIRVNGDAGEFAYQGEKVFAFGFNETENSASRLLGDAVYEQLDRLGEGEMRLLNGTVCDFMKKRILPYAILGEDGRKPVGVIVRPPAR